MMLRWALAVGLLLQAAPAWPRVVAARVHVLTPNPVTIFARQVHREPVRVRLVRADNGAPVAGVPIYLEVSIISCAPLLQCGLPTLDWYGYWEGAADPDSWMARLADVVTDARGEATLPRLVGGSFPFEYTISFFLAPGDGYELDYRDQPYLRVEQVSAPHVRPTAIPTLQPLALLICLLAVLGCTAAIPVIRAP